MSQKQNEEEKFIAEAGGKTTKYEANFASVKSELAAIIFAVEKFEHLLCFCRFRIITDSAGLRYLKTLKSSRGTRFRWLQELESFQYEGVHQAGKLIPHVDELSRSGHFSLKVLFLTC